MGITLGELAVQFSLDLHGDPETTVTRVGTLAGAGENALTFLANPQYRKQLQVTKAAVVVLDAGAVDDCPTDCLVSTNHYASYARIAQHLHPPAPLNPGIHPTATIGDGVAVDPSVEVGAQCVVGSDVKIGPGVLLGPGCIIGDGVRIGAQTRLAAQVTLLQNVVVGEHSMLHPGVVIGADGFGFAADSGIWQKVPQLGSVVVGDDVEIGAHTTIDRGAIDDTVIENGVKLDNHIVIGHNVRIGEHTIIAAKVGVSGSTRIGKRCMVAAEAAFVGHIDIADDCVITARAVMNHSVTEPGVFAGLLVADEIGKWRKNAARFRSLDSFVRKLKQLEKTIAMLVRERDK
ncbi:MAG: UDP-3-O-(3-hydroxymyristoyl)glucosamine N-acyltransferase [Gammaproteobacteria bacterium]